MKSILCLASLIAAMGFLRASASDWTTDYRAALKQAQAQNKLVLLDFTGSDWCGYCKLLDKEVLSRSAFQRYADRNYILVTVDFPHAKQLPADLKRQNDALNKRFKIVGFPTLIVLNAKGGELGRSVGYPPGTGPSATIAKLKAFDNRKR